MYCELGEDVCGEIGHLGHEKETVCIVSWDFVRGEKFPDIPIQRSFDMAHFEVRGNGHFEVRGKLPPCATHTMVDQR